MAAGKSDPLGGPSPRPPLSAVWVSLFYAAVGGVAICWRLWADGVLPWRSGPAAASAPVWLRLGLGVGSGLGLVVLSRLAAERTHAGRSLASELARLLGALSVRRAWGFALVSGIAEEALFRGALQPQVGWLAATLLFAAAHYVPRRGLRVWALFALLAGAWFGVLFERTGDLLAPAAAHVVINGFNLRWLSRGGPR